MLRKVYLDFGAGFQEITDLVRYDTLSITTRAFSDNFHYAQNECSFDVVYDATVYSGIMSATDDIIVKIENYYDQKSVYTENYASILAAENGSTFGREIGGIEPFFYGRIQPTRSRKYDGNLQASQFTIEAADELDLLKVEAGVFCYRNYHIMDSTDISNSIVHQLAYRAGFVEADISTAVTISTVVEAFTPTDKTDLIIDMLDTLLFEYGYTLNIDAEGKIRPIKWQRYTSQQVYGYYFNGSNIIDEVEIDDGIKEYTGAEVTWYELNEAVTSGTTISGIKLYHDSDLPWENGVPTGYPVPSGMYYPLQTNVIDDITGSGYIVYQEYDDTATKYWTNDAVVKNIDYNYKAFKSDFSGIVATSGWILDWAGDSGISITVSGFENTRARVQFLNTTSGFANLYYIDIYGKVLYRSTERKPKSAGSTDDKLDKYVSQFIFDEDSADFLTKYLTLQHQIGDVRYKFKCEYFENIQAGDYVNIQLNDGTNQNCLVMEKIWQEKDELYRYIMRACNLNTGSINLTASTIAVSPVLRIIPIISSKLTSVNGVVD